MKYRLIALVVVALCAASTLAANRYGLVIGVDKCESVGKLEVCSKDARAMKAMLERVGYAPQRIILLTDDSTEFSSWPTLGNIEKELDRLAKVAAPGDTILLFFSGHGITRDGDAFLVPTDGSRSRGVALSGIKAQLLASQAGQKILILDACHAGAAKGVNGIAPDLKAAGGLSMLLSCDKDQVSWPDAANGHSVFTFYVLEAFSGQAAGPDRKLTFGKLSAYVQERVKDWTFAHRKDLQTPVFVSASEDAVLAECPEEDVIVERQQPPPPPIQTPETGLPKELTLDCGYGASLRLALIPAGEFMMGGEESPEQIARKCGGEDAKAEWFQHEQPRHRVKISKPFYMGVHEVTQAQYEAVIGANPAYFKGAGNLPVEQVSWNEATEFCRKLSAKTGQTVRLPTEAEWEYACRAGATTAFSFGETISTDQANYDGNYTYGSGRKGLYRQKTTPVCSFPANAFGLFDMHGNVCEWCQDWYGSYPGNEVVDPQGPTNGDARVLRGGSWIDVPRDCRSANRYWYVPAIRGSSFGFRVVCAPRP